MESLKTEDTEETKKQISKNRKNYNKKPTLLIISGESMVGKTTLSFLLKEVKKSYYVSLDQLTLDVNLPIDDTGRTYTNFPATEQAMLECIF